MKRCLLLGISFCVLLAVPGTAALPAQGQAEHVVVVVWDGMRPDFVTPQYTPTLYALANEGVFFKNHHAAYPSSTEVNGTAIATGAHPDRSGIMANNDYRPALGWLGPNATEGLDVIRRGDFLTGGHYLLVPTVAEILQQAGFPTITAGAKPVVLLHDRAGRRTSEAARNSVNLFKGQAIPKSILPSLVKANDDKAFPSNTIPNTAMDAWTTKAVTHGLWKKGVPKYTVLWLSDPDASQHDSGVGSDHAIASIANCDKNLEEVLKMLDEKKVRSKTDILVTSDHGFSTIRRGPDATEILKKAKFKATKKFEDPEPGEVLVVGLGGSVAFYVWEHDPALIRKLAAFLQGTDFAAVIFSRLPIEGTFPMEQARIATTNVTPDLVVALRWSEDRSDHGAPGMLISEGGTRGKGSHTSLSRFDMRNTLVAQGPDFKKSLVSELPSGSIDLAPTILWILGVPQPEASPMNGRVLQEALVRGGPVTAQPETRTLEATRDFGWLRWHQYLKFTRLGDTIYFDEGNGGCSAK